MSFTDTEKHWLWGCAAATAASKSDVKVAMPHLRGKWSPTNAILRTLEPSFMRQSFIPRAPRCCTRVCSPTANVPPQHEESTLPELENPLAGAREGDSGR